MLSYDFCEILRLYAVLPHSFLRSSRLANLQMEIFVKYVLILLFLETPTVLDVDLKGVTNKDQPINIRDIYHFEEVWTSCFKKGAIFAFSLAALLLFSHSMFSVRNPCKR